MRIAFITQSKAHLPELYAYRQYFESKGIEVFIFPQTPAFKALEGYSVEWHIMGIDRLPKHPQRIKIHEYTSLSTPPFAPLKNKLKRLYNVQADIRIFQNEWLADEINLFNRKWIYREMGVADLFFTQHSVKKEYDFVYTGSLENNRKLPALVSSFLNNFPAHYTFLLIGNIPAWLRKLDTPRLKLVDSIPYWEVPKWLHKAEYGINYIVDQYPFNQQTSTKLIEYCAAGLKIISTSYHWLDSFEKEHGGHFFRIKEDGRNFNPENLKAFQFITPEVPDLSWDSIFSSSDFQKLLKWIGLSV